MSEFGGDQSSAHMPWREQRLERDTSSVLPQEPEGHHHHHHTQSHSHLPPVYDHYSPGPASEAEEYREWPTSASHEEHNIGSPHSSAGSMIDSPHSHPSSHSEHRHSVDITGQSSGSQGEHHMSLSERRQEKRKMKRFRLTHNQTRFLMSEFARQAHPDAAHRERLAREIPGLSPRQVQVWFQNRRAKLKRMSSDDRERMMKSRALPEEFPILQTLHNYGSGRMMGTPIASPTEYSPTTNMGYRADPLRRRHLGEDDVVVSPTTPGFAGLSFTPTTSSGELLSPVSSTGERSSYLGYMTAPLGPQQRGNPFSRTTDPFRGSVPRLQLQDIPRSMSESASSPLRSSTPYSGNTLDHGEYQLSPSAYSIQGLPFNEPPRSVPPETPHSPYVHTPQAQYTHPYPSPAPPSGHQARQQPPSYPPPLTLSDFKYPQPPLTPHSGTMSGFATAPLAPPQEFQIPQMSAPADATTFSSSYLTRGTTGSLGSATAPGAPHHEEERQDRISLLGREYGHQRKRSSSHPPNFPQNREP